MLQCDCKVLKERMRELFKAQEALEEVVESEDEIGKLDKNLEELARENNAILRQVGDRIKDLEAVLVERNSKRSTLTRKSTIPKEAIHPINWEKVAFLWHSGELVLKKISQP